MKKSYILTLPHNILQDGLARNKIIIGFGAMGKIHLKILAILYPNKSTYNQYVLLVKSIEDSYFDEDNPFSYIYYNKINCTNANVIKTTDLTW